MQPQRDYKTSKEAADRRKRILGKMRRQHISVGERQNIDVGAAVREDERAKGAKKPERHGSRHDGTEHSPDG